MVPKENENVCSECGEAVLGLWLRDKSGFQNLVSECCRKRITSRGRLNVENQ